MCVESIHSSGDVLNWTGGPLKLPVTSSPLCDRLAFNSNCERSSNATWGLSRYSNRLASVITSNAASASAVPCFGYMTNFIEFQRVLKAFSIRATWPSGSSVERRRLITRPCEYHKKYARFRFEGCGTRRDRRVARAVYISRHSPRLVPGRTIEIANHRRDEGRHPAIRPSAAYASAQYFPPSLIN